LGWGTPDLEFNELRAGVLMAFECLTESLMEEEYDYIKKELFLDDPLASKAAQKLIDDWKKQLSGDKQLLGDELHDNLRIVSNCVKRSNLKTNKFIEANFHMRCLLISKMEKLPQYIRRNSSDYCQKLAANHAGLIYHGGFYYKTFHIELVSIGGSTLDGFI